MIEEQIYDAAVIDVNRAIMMFAVLSCGTFLIPVRAKPPQHCIVVVQVVCQTRFAASRLSSEEERSLSKRFARMWALPGPNTRAYATGDTGHAKQSRPTASARMRITASRMEQNLSRCHPQKRTCLANDCRQPWVTSRFGSGLGSNALHLWFLAAKAAWNSLRPGAR